MLFFNDNGNDGIAVRRTGRSPSTRLCHLGEAVARCSLPRRLRCQASSVVVGRVKALGLSAGIAIVALDRSRILLDERFGVHADPRRSGNDNDDSIDDNKDNYDYTTGDLLSLAASFGDDVVGADGRYPPAYHGDFERNVFDQVCSFGLEVSDFFIALCMLRVG